jgi:hypothetical protein
MFTDRDPCAIDRQTGRHFANRIVWVAGSK